MQNIYLNFLIQKKKNYITSIYEKKASSNELPFLSASYKKSLFS